MYNRGPNTNGSQFMVTLKDRGESLDGTHCAFGQVVEGWDVLAAMEQLGDARQEGETFQRITIETCGVVGPGRYFPPRHPTLVDPRLNARFLIFMTSYDVARNPCQALLGGEGRCGGGGNGGGDGGCCGRGGAVGGGWRRRRGIQHGGGGGAGQAGARRCREVRGAGGGGAGGGGTGARFEEQQLDAGAGRRRRGGVRVRVSTDSV